MDSRHGTVIRAKHYDETVTALIMDPIIQAMVTGLVNDPSLDAKTAVHNLVTTGWAPGFMQVALREYTARGGKVPTHIGGPAEAITAILRDRAAR
jgi:hypothetical protein